MGFLVAPIVWAAVAGYWLVLRPRLVAAGRWPAQSESPARLRVGIEVCLSLALAGLGGWLATPR